MRCIFCKTESSNTKSVEHIIPESLGNKEHILRNGIVCDNCNQYFSSKIEKPVLEKSYFISVRHRNFIESKKNRIPLERAYISNDPNIFIDVNKGDRSVIIENPQTVNKILNGQVGCMIVPNITNPPPNDRDISRFLGKIAIEVLAYKLYLDQEWIDEIVDKVELDELRYYVRVGNKPNFWEYYQRRIYNEQDRFENPKIISEPYEVLHEFTLLYTENFELYLVLAIMGIEYALNFTNPRIEGYAEWLNKNNQISPLFDSNEKRITNKHKSLWSPGDTLKFMTKP